MRWSHTHTRTHVAHVLRNVSISLSPLWLGYVKTRGKRDSGRLGRRGTCRSHDRNSQQSLFTACEKKGQEEASAVRQEEKYENHFILNWDRLNLKSETIARVENLFTFKSRQMEVDIYFFLSLNKNVSKKYAREKWEMIPRDLFRVKV